ncbi:MAG: MerR family transcriptional regulator [Nitrospirota bacterium]
MSIGNDTYGTGEACRLVGISQRQLEYWVLIGVVKPDIHPHGSRFFKRFTKKDIEILTYVKRLTDEGFLVSKAAEKARYLFGA